MTAPAHTARKTAADMNNPFKPIPQRPERGPHPAWDQYRDPVYHAAFPDQPRR